MKNWELVLGTDQKREGSAPDQSVMDIANSGVDQSPMNSATGRNQSVNSSLVADNSRRGNLKAVLEKHMQK